ncbi:non-canonical purine NTP pyrophosphatase [Staphylospora marina]|uniref:non-canonical purine NTP pyrophosphatase n=1 Tax=Staphylospora marina TaxID=2490858 RepID=UPI000F5BE617|nr:non-canonical purine NTP pyrophosphatase [Staphylospora marina]
MDQRRDASKEQARRVMIATGNPGKQDVMRNLLASVGYSGVSPRESGISVPDIREDGFSPEENALIKARAYAGLTDLPVFAADSGMEIDALGGRPGVMVRRWNGELPDDVGDEEWLVHFLRKTKGIPPEKRTGRFVTAWAVVRDGREFTRRVLREFRFSTEPVRNMIPGFPMSAVIFDHDAADAMETIWLPAFIRWIRDEDVFG